MKNFLKTAKFLLLFLVFSSAANAYYALQKPSGYVSDYASLLSGDQKQALENKLAEFEKNSSHEISIVTILSLKDDSIENFAAELFKEWKIGKKGQDNGVLILISLQDRQMRIEVGYGLEGALTDAQSSWIIDDIIKPAFRAKNYYQGLDEAVEKIILATKGENISSGSKREEKSLTTIEKFGVVIFLCLWLTIFMANFLGKSKSYWAGGLVGGLLGAALSVIIQKSSMLLLFAGLFGILGLVFDYYVSKNWHLHKKWPWDNDSDDDSGGSGSAGSGSRFGSKRSSGSGFRGFSGGSSGGGGASGRW